MAKPGNRKTNAENCLQITVLNELCDQQFVI